MNYPLRHISIRVPWHDTGWDGRVCAAPRLNGSCLKLKRIAEDRDDAAEEARISLGVDRLQPRRLAHDLAGLAPRLGERLGAPRPPVDGIARVRAQVRASGIGEAVGHGSSLP